MTIKYAHMNYLLLFVSMSYLSNHILCRATEKHMQNRPKKKIIQLSLLVIVMNIIVMHINII